jgi:hypothetical protein
MASGVTRTAGAHTEADVGTVLPLALRPRLETLRILSRLVDEPARRVQLSRGQARDQRIGAAEWDRVVARELAHILAWAVRRLRGPAYAVQPKPVWSARGRALVLLPRHGHAVHAIRRALPFALCGVPTVVTGHAHQTDLVKHVVLSCAATAGLSTTDLSAAEASAPAVVAGADPYDLVVVTGSADTATKVRQNTAATVLSACGQCTVGIGTRRWRLDRLGAALKRHQHPGSCTNWRGYFIGDWHTGSWTDAHGTSVDLPGELSRLHPTAVYAPVHDLDAASDLPRRLHGYSVHRCTTDGVVADLVGFGRDPSGGWPGDFTV